MCMKLKGHKIPKNDKTKTKILNYNCFSILNAKNMIMYSPFALTCLFVCESLEIALAYSNEITHVYICTKLHVYICTKL
jgi:hypothetical protein